MPLPIDSYKSGTIFTSGSSPSCACFKCGSCCEALDISTLRKPRGKRCEHLKVEGTCGIYDNRPEVCRAYRADEICVLISDLSPLERLRVLDYVYYGEE